MAHDHCANHSDTMAPGSGALKLLTVLKGEVLNSPDSLMTWNCKDLQKGKCLWPCKEAKSRLVPPPTTQCTMLTFGNFVSHATCNCMTDMPFVNCGKSSFFSQFWRWERVSQRCFRSRLLQNSPHSQGHLASCTVLLRMGRAILPSTYAKHCWLT